MSVSDFLLIKLLYICFLSKFLTTSKNFFTLQYCLASHFPRPLIEHDEVYEPRYVV